MPRFTDLRIAVLTADGAEELELTQPLLALRDEGAWVQVVAPQDRPLQAFSGARPGTTVAVDCTLANAHADDYDALLLPGGARAVQELVGQPQAVAFVRTFQQAGKPIAAVGHAPLLLAATRLLAGRNVTGHPAARTSVLDAGALWADHDLVGEDNLLTARGEGNLPAFVQAVCTLFERSPVPEGVHPRGQTASAHR